MIQKIVFTFDNGIRLAIRVAPLIDGKGLPVFFDPDNPQFQAMFERQFTTFLDVVEGLPYAVNFSKVLCVSFYPPEPMPKKRGKKK